jgi:hypothetical protein
MGSGRIGTVVASVALTALVGCAPQQGTVIRVTNGTISPIAIVRNENGVPTELLHLRPGETQSYPIANCGVVLAAVDTSSRIVVATLENSCVPAWTVEEPSPPPSPS